MRYVHLVFLGALTLGCAPRRVEHPREIDVAGVERSAREAGTAWGTGDMPALERLISKDYVHVDIYGLVLGRAAWLDQSRTRGTTFTVTFDDVIVTPLGNAFLVTGHNRISDSSGRDMDLRFSQIWVEEGGMWRRRSFQATRSLDPATPLTDVAKVQAEAEVRAAATAWAEAIQRRDVEAAGRFLGAEYALMAPGLGEMPRAKWLESLPSYVVHSYEHTDVRVHVYGETAVMRSRYKQQATVFGKDRSGEMLVTDVWVKRDDRWQVVARHSSMLGS